MPPTFIVKNRYGKKLGELIFSKKKFTVKITFPEDRKNLEELLSTSVKEGIRNLGEVVLDKPLKLGDPLFFKALEDLLIRKGYLVVVKK